MIIIRKQFKIIDELTRLTGNDHLTHSFKKICESQDSENYIRVATVRTTESILGVT